MTVKEVAAWGKKVTDHEEINHLRGRVDELYDEVKLLRKEANDREKQRLRWGAGVLGAVVLAMGGWIWSQVEHLITINIGPRP